MQTRIRIILVAMQINTKNVLLFKKITRDHPQGIWCFPEDEVRYQEKTINTVHRLLEQSVGVTPGEVQPMGIHENIEGNQHTIYIVMGVPSFAAEPDIVDPDILELLWVDKAGALQKETDDYIKSLINKFL